MPTYHINGSTIQVIRKEEKEGTTILEGMIHAIILENQKKSSGLVTANENSKSYLGESQQRRNLLPTVSR